MIVKKCTNIQTQSFSHSNHVAQYFYRSTHFNMLQMSSTICTVDRSWKLVRIKRCFIALIVRSLTAHYQRKSDQ